MSEERAVSTSLSRADLIARLTRFYPFYSGTGWFSSRELLLRLAGRPRGDAWMKVRGGRLRLPLDDLVGRAIYFAGDIDPKVSWVLRQAARPGDTALDIGANIGFVTLMLAERVGVAGRVHAFEPNPAMLWYLKQSLAASALPQVSVYEIGLADMDATMTLSASNGNAGSATLATEPDPGFIPVANVAVRRLDGFVQETDIDRIDIIKIDVEGLEASVLRGASDTIDKFHPKLILIEERGSISKNHMPESLNILKVLDYELYSLPRRALSVRLQPIEGAERFERVHDYVALSRRSCTSDLRQALGVSGRV